MKYWIGVASMRHIERGIKYGMFGIGHGKVEPLKRIKPGDKIVFYAPKIDHTKTDGENVCQKFRGFGTISDEPIFTEEISGHCMARRPLDWEGKDKEFPIQTLIQTLDFIKNKKKWGFPFMRGLIEISQKDFETIVSHIR